MLHEKQKKKTYIDSMENEKDKSIAQVAMPSKYEFYKNK